MGVGSGTYSLGPAAGRVCLRTARAGLVARAGHDLLIEVTRWSATVEVPAGDDLTTARITAELDLGSLAVREGTGGVKPLTAKDREDIAKTMRTILSGGGSPMTATFASARIIPSHAGGAIEGTVTFRGRTQPVRLQVMAPAPGRYRGSATVPQTAFGITPYTGFFGALKLRDEVTLEFDVTLPEAAQKPS